MKSIRNVTIRDGNNNYRDLQFSKRTRYDAESPESYLIRLAEEIPANQLRKVS